MGGGTAEHDTIDKNLRVSLHAQEPVTMFEALSKSTAWIDQSPKLPDYDATPTIRTYVPISLDEQRALACFRDASMKWPLPGTRRRRFA